MDEHPEVDICLAALDEKLNEKGYIVPGTWRCSGDRIFGTKSHEGSASGYAADVDMALACGAAVWIGAWLDDVFNTFAMVSY